MKPLKVITGVLCAMAVVTGPCSFASAAQQQEKPRYVVLSWNDLGMHCYNADYADLAVLPPYNTLWALVIQIGDPPRIVTDGLTVEYSFPENTYSAGMPGKPDKTNFWQHVAALFGKDLPANTGLAGKGLRGVMDKQGDHFVAAGIPITEYSDQDVRDTDRSQWERHPYQMALVVVRDTASGQELCRSTPVVPASNELGCATCHSDTGIATQRNHIVPTSKVATNILTLHDRLNRGKYRKPLMESRPVLCARCHASNALGMKGDPRIPSLSNAVHARHAGLKEVTKDTAGCYQCHPGKTAQCLRDTMSIDFKLSCIDCHGDMRRVSKNPQPWLKEPRCDNASCHGAGYSLDKPLYRNSKGFGGMYCAACHDSPHAIAPSREEQDGEKFFDLQNDAGTLQKCTVCHATMPERAFVHNPKDQDKD